MFRASTIGKLRDTKLADCFMSADFFSGIYENKFEKSCTFN
jgi:hypothetical protein